MQLCNITLRLSGSLLHTVPKADVTPAEIVVLRYIHGNDAVVDIRPTRVDERVRHEQEYERLSQLYDTGAGAFVGQAGDERKAIMPNLFPGAIKRLPTTLEEIGVMLDEPETAPPATPYPGPQDPTMEPDAADDSELVGGSGDDDDEQPSEATAIDPRAFAAAADPVGTVGDTVPGETE